ncbi:DNA N-6-adenine-methyltransferase [Sulfitobacter sp. 20_GPM-1509m]|uniref:DNA N-6-adenine-methyltransferase n=1 Tax=Sulfitobacter sp. 20_GPM-1509m TaxID=1380367 RepID=UPI0009DD3560
MGSWEASGASDEWYTPRFVFDALGVTFDLDVANSAIGGRHVPCKASIGADSLSMNWQGFIWMNPPFGGRNGLVPWMSKFFDHGNGIALTPDRTSAPWWQDAHARADAFLFTRGKIKFERHDGTIGKSPGSGVTLWASGGRGVDALYRARSLGALSAPATPVTVEAE